MMFSKYLTRVTVENFIGTKDALTIQQGFNQVTAGGICSGGGIEIKKNTQPIRIDYSPPAQFGEPDIRFGDWMAH